MRLFVGLFLHTYKYNENYNFMSVCPSVLYLSRFQPNLQELLGPFLKIISYDNKILSHLQLNAWFSMRTDILFKSLNNIF